MSGLWFGMEGLGGLGFRGLGFSSRFRVCGFGMEGLGFRLETPSEAQEERSRRLGCILDSAP